ncbi:rod shape-determining protein MreC [Polaromonas sp. AET17H-212]|uniref:rod shape-determining protein MreC n=1 Tax=Polaromonas sp. AET17H-212 TaxID=1977061 RepID=UPI000BBB9E28|nr:rod shape-determining protein MreC [Polaromonas sp. AET17H-212]
MPLGTLDRTPPPFFKQGPSALSKLMFFSALALFLMVADLRFKITQPIRAAVATVLYPVQWLALQPVRAAQHGGGYFTALSQARTSEEVVRQKLATQSLRASQVEQLALENSRLRKLLDLRERAALTGQAAQVLYDAPDPYTRKVIIDKGLLQGVALGSPVVDESGVLGQVTRVHPLVSEVTLVIDRELAIPVLNTRTGARSVAFGEPTTHGGGLELRFMGSNSDVQQGDLLTTSGVDGVYPPGLPVAKIDRIERRAESAFARIYCTPQAQVNAAVHVMVVKPLSGEKLPSATAEPVPVKKGAGK